MKITILSTTYPLRGGIAHFMGLLYKQLKKEHEVNVITFKRQYPTLLFPGKSQYESSDTVEELPSRVLVDSINPFNWIRIGNLLKKEAPDLIIFKYWMPFFAPCFGTILSRAKKNGKTKGLVICDNVLPHEKRPGDKILTKYLFNKVDHFITMSGSVNDDLIKMKPESHRKLLFHPVYSNFGEPVEKSEARKKLQIENKKTMLFFGFIREYKGLDILLKAAEMIKDKLDYNLIVAGEFYDDKQKYLDMITDMKLNDKVKLYSDFIPTNEVKYFFSASDVVVLPYKSATQSGITQIANNFLKPIIATDTGGLGEVIENGVTGYLVEKNDPEELASAILRFYNEGKEKEFSDNIREKQDKFSWEKFSSALIDFVNE